MRTTAALVALLLAGCTNRYEGGGTAVGNPARTAIRPPTAVAGLVNDARFVVGRCDGSLVTGDPADADLTDGSGPPLPGGLLCTLTLAHGGLTGGLTAPAGQVQLIPRDLRIDGGDYVLELGEPGGDPELGAGLYRELVADGILDPVERSLGAAAFGPLRVDTEPGPAPALVQTGPEGRLVLRTEPDLPDYPSVDESGLELVGVAFGDGIWVAVGGDGYAGVSSVSLDGGLTWTTHAHDFPLDDVAFAGGVFAATSIQGVIDRFDGTGWTRAVAPALGYKAVAASDSGFLAVAGTDVAVSADGVTWTEAALPGVVGFGADAAAWGDGRWVAVGDAGYRLTSVDGLTWTDATSGGNILRDVLWDGSLFWAVGAYEAWSSPDGVSWTAESPKDLHRLALHRGEPYAMDTGGWIYQPVPGSWQPVFEPPDDGVFYGFGSSAP